MSDTPVAIRGERSLWAAVIQTAIEDARGNVRGLTGPAARTESQRARIWLTRPNKDFNEVCYLAGLDPVAVRERCQRIFADEPAEPHGTKRPIGSRSRRYEWNGESLTLCEWADRLGLSVSAIMSRMKNGMTFEQAVTTPRLKRGVPWQAGVVLDFAEPLGTGAGSVVQDISQIEFSE